MPKRRPVLPVVALGAALAVGACSVEDGPTGERAPTLTAAPTTLSTAPESPTTTTIPLSSAVIEIGPAVYDLDAICAAGGASEVEVAVNGVDVNGKPVIGLVRAFEAEPYIGLRVGDDGEAVLFEPRLGGVLEFDLVENVLEFAEVDFVSALDLATGSFVPAGLGSVTVECRSFVRDLPEVSLD